MTAHPGGQDLVPRPEPFKPYKFRVFLIDNNYYDILGTIPWPEWIERLKFYEGLAWNNGFIPKHMIRLCIFLDEEGQVPPKEEYTGNVIPLKRSS